MFLNSGVNLGTSMPRLNFHQGGVMRTLFEG
jgi:hypothetical protein